MTSRSYVFTLNNPEEFDVDSTTDEDHPLCQEFQELSHLRYAVYQYELGETYTPHFQGYLEFSRPTRIAAIKIGQLAFAHFETRKGTRHQARDYSSKPEGRVAGPWHFGTWTGGQGARTDLEDATAALLASRNLRDVALQHPTSFVKFHGGLAKLLEITRPLPELTTLDWRPWQAEALGLLQGEPHPRRVHWYVDFTGGAGKSYFVRHLATNCGALPLSSGRHDRLLNAWSGERIITFDFPRDVAPGGSAGDSQSGDRTPYAVIEAIKNGVVFSGFFGAGPRIFPVPHVLCFSNFEPDRSKLSHDRWDVHYIRPDDDDS